MSENSSPLASINSWLREATKRLQDAEIRTARLDALVLLADEYGQDKSWVLAHDEQLLTEAQRARLAAQLTDRANHTPLAYIRGKQEFFGREFAVTPDVLIPRPETEVLIELLLSLDPQPHDRLVDVGTGSGAIAITAKLERPELEVLATDVSAKALAVARQNAHNLQAKVAFSQQDLLQPTLSKPVRFIVANLPYVAQHWERSKETAFEPAMALFAANDGLAFINKLIEQSVGSLAPGGFLLLEADPRQHQAIEQTAQQHGYRRIASQDFCLCFQGS